MCAPILGPRAPPSGQRQGARTYPARALCATRPAAGILMRMSERYYVDQPLALGPVGLAGPEAHHLAVVCRVRPGDRVYLFNGDGRQYLAAVTEAAKRGVRLDVEAVEEPRRELA